MRNCRGVALEGLHSVLLHDHIFLEPQLLDMVAHISEVDRDCLLFEVVDVFYPDLLVRDFLVFLGLLGEPPRVVLLRNLDSR